MYEQSTHQLKHTDNPKPWNLRWGWWGFAAIAGFLLLYEHLAHVVEWLPWLFLLACPLLHVFMHGGHGDHEKGHRHD